MIPALTGNVEPRKIQPLACQSEGSANFKCGNSKARTGGMSDRRKPISLDAETRERLGECTLALAEEIFRIGDPHLIQQMRELMLQIGRVIARNFEPEDGPVQRH